MARCVRFDPLIDKHSETWRHVSAWAAEKLQEARELNDRQGVPIDQTENLRGRIETLKEVLALAEPPKPLPLEPQQGYGFQGADGT